MKYQNFLNLISKLKLLNIKMGNEKSKITLGPESLKSKFDEIDTI